MTDREAWRNAPSPALPLALAAVPLVYDAYVFLGIRGGRDAFLLRAGDPSLAGGVFALALIAAGLLGHAFFAARTAKSVPIEEVRGHLSSGNRRLQQGSGLVALVFLLAHLRHSVFVAGVFGLGGAGLYERIRNDCDGFGWLALYLVGLGACTLHVAQGAYAVAKRGRYAHEATRHGIAIGLVTATLISYAALVNALSAFALGTPLLLGP